MSNINQLAQMMGDACYLFLAMNGLWGLYCVIIVWRRLMQLSFRRAGDSLAFVEDMHGMISSGDTAGALEYCQGDARALPQLAYEALNNADLSLEKLRQYVAERFQQDVLSDLEHRTSWIVTVIKSGPLLGLFGTVLGMMAAFGRIGSGEKVEPAHIAHEISIALVCTAMGLITAIPLNFLLSTIRIRIQKLHESVGVGMGRLLNALKPETDESAYR